MGFEDLFKRKANKSPEEQKRDNDRNKKIGMAAGIAGLAAASTVAYEANTEKPLPFGTNDLAAESLAPSENSIAGMNSADAPKPITVSREAAPQKAAEMPGAITSKQEHDVIEPIVKHIVVNPTMEQKVVDITEKNYTVRPEM